MKLIPKNKTKTVCRIGNRIIIIIIIIKIKTETLRRYTYKFVQFWLIYIKEQVRKDERAGGKSRKNERKKMIEFCQW